MIARFKVLNKPFQLC